MTHEHLTLLRVLAIAAVALAGPPRLRPLRVAFRLLLSRQVIVREYRTADLAPSEKMLEKHLSRMEIVCLALVFVMPQGWTLSNRCLFNPHHDIQMTSTSGRKSTAVICFECNMLQFFTQPATDSSVSFFGTVFDKLLRFYFQWIGMPVRPRRYL